MFPLMPFGLIPIKYKTGRIAAPSPSLHLVHVAFRVAFQTREADQGHVAPAIANEPRMIGGRTYIAIRRVWA